MSEELNVHVDTSTRIRKPLAEVFEAVVAPKHLDQFFTQAARGRIETGSTVYWKFSDLEKELPVQVVECILNEKIVLKWEAHKVSYQTTVELTFEDQKEKGTLVRIRELGWKPDAIGLQSSYSHTEGWVHMACCMKAYLEHGIDLRNGSGACNGN
jgi:uncharacterized protein YndB with AHSA1/START domain